MIELLNTDCLEYMAKQPDNAFELAIVDPPYGLGFGTFNRTNKDSAGNRYKANKYHHDDWDQAIPDDLYFQELLRVSKNQIVWGGNYFPYLWTKPCRGFIYWHKGNPVPNFSDGELAWTSFDRPAKQFDFRYYGGLEGKTSAEDKIHPTQKPVKLYEWLFANYHNAGGGGAVLDTHLGSGSIAIAAHKMKVDLVACEINPQYYQATMKRFNDFTAQQTLF